jgi:hypothetical protein
MQLILGRAGRAALIGGLLLTTALGGSAFAAVAPGDGGDGGDGTPTGAVVTYGSTSLGVNNLGDLNYYGNGPGGPMTYGVYRAGVGDAISPGCPCEGWGVAVTTGDGGRTSGYANESSGNGGLTGGTFGYTTTTATSSIGLSGAPVTVEHLYGPSLAADTFQVQVRITNTGTETLHDLVYRRAMDWDVPPTEFNELVTHHGVEANLEANGGNVRYASDNGFADSNPLTDAGSVMPESVNKDFVDLGPEDHGSVFDFAFGDLAPNATRLFNIYYGSASSEGGALGAVSAVGANLYSLGQNSGPGGNNPGTPATYLFAFGGVGGIEPGTRPDVPILPFVAAPGVMEFPAPIPGRWYDPPFASGFEYALTGGQFTQVGAPPGSFGFGPVQLWINGVLIATLNPGDTFDFGSNVTDFQLRGINPNIDINDPNFTTAFPTFLNFTSGSLLTMTALPAAVPVPAALPLMGSALAALGLLRRRKAK